MAGRGRAAAVVLGVLGAIPCAGGAPATIGGRGEAALAYVDAHAAAWIDALARRGADPGLLVPAVFPEILRWSPARDEVESLGLAVLYVGRGAAAADFSIGRFQMKPSFAERVEAALGPSPPPALAEIQAWAPGLDERGRRAARLDRLRDPAWQLAYLAAFGRIVSARFDLAGMEEMERVRFVAAAYNRGFWHPREEIEAATGWRIFPGGPAGRAGMLRYTDVAVDFYLGWWKDRVR